MDENKSTGMEECEIRHKHRSAKEEKRPHQPAEPDRGTGTGVKAMVQDERYCTDILVQVSAIQSALNGFSRTLLSSHVKSCVVEEIKTGMRIRPWTSCADHPENAVKRIASNGSAMQRSACVFVSCRHLEDAWRNCYNCLKKMKNMVDIFEFYIILTSVIEAWLSLVERCVRDAEVASSETLSPRLQGLDGQAVKTTPSHGVNPVRFPVGHLLLQSCCSSIFTRCFLGSVGRATHS